MDWRIVGLGLGLVVTLGVALWFWPAWTPGVEPVAGAPQSIASLEEVPIGGTKLWLLIRGRDTRKPILLFLHGGPGTSQLGLNRANTRSLEEDYLVVNWDQRGAGKSYDAGADPSKMTIAQFIEDTVGVTRWLLARFGQQKVILVGHSWGSALGVLTVRAHPELYAAYVGIGQVSDMVESEKLSWRWTLDQARHRGDLAAIETLTKAGEPPYAGDWKASFLAQRALLSGYHGDYHATGTDAFSVVIGSLVGSPEYTWTDRVNFFRGIFRSLDLLFPQLMAVNLFVQAPELAVPVVFMLGRHDQQVPSSLSEAYFRALEAPWKKLYWFEDSAHLINTEERDLFNARLKEALAQVPGS